MMFRWLEISLKISFVEFLITTKQSVLKITWAVFIYIPSIPLEYLFKMQLPWQTAIHAFISYNDSRKCLCMHKAHTAIFNWIFISKCIVDVNHTCKCILNPHQIYVTFSRVKLHKKKRSKRRYMTLHNLLRATIRTYIIPYTLLVAFLENFLLRIYVHIVTCKRLYPPTAYTHHIQPTYMETSHMHFSLRSFTKKKKHAREYSRRRAGWPVFFLIYYTPHVLNSLHIL